ncbi:hypothetical protein FQR65_LT02625 [Abscondita terminalis]|nr:hypothetical protein FQR65_LT02625 [Abscondita terminalis]
MLEDVTAAMSIGQRITLHRIPAVNTDDQTQENLENLKIKMHPKKLAQKYYYENSEQSPLLRGTTLHKKPVHERLGNVRRKFTYNFQPNIRNKNKENVKNNRITLRKNLAQARIQSIRQSANFMRNPTLIPKLRLHRNTPTHPMNYKILVQNEIAYKSEGFEERHSVHGSLTASLQQEIKIIQIQNTVEPCIIPNMSIVTVGYGCTGISMNTRFSSLP